MKVKFGKGSIVLLIVTAVLSTSAAVSVHAGENDIDSAMIVSEHNKWRSEVGSPNIRWSTSLARVAQAWADNLKIRGCVMEHSRDNRYGENIYWAGPLKTANSKDKNGNWLWRSEKQDVNGKKAVDGWAGEKKDYNYSRNSCAAGEMCGHYTQIIWKNTLEVGCGMAVCDDKSQVWVCNYNPPGNYVGQKPY